MVFPLQYKDFCEKTIREHPYVVPRLYASGSAADATDWWWLWCEPCEKWWDEKHRDSPNHFKILCNKGYGRNAEDENKHAACSCQSDKRVRPIGLIPPPPPVAKPNPQPWAIKPPPPADPPEINSFRGKFICTLERKRNTEPWGLPELPCIINPSQMSGAAEWLQSYIPPQSRVLSINRKSTPGEWAEELNKKELLYLEIRLELAPWPTAATTGSVGISFDV